MNPRFNFYQIYLVTYVWLCIYLYSNINSRLSNCTEMKEQKYIAYYRVSTQKQGKSGLGLEAQKNLVHNFINCADCLLGEYTETESGKNNTRPQLQKAIDKSKELGATLVIAKLDRLSRSAAFIFQLKDANVNFVCADMPDANTLTIGIFASLAQYERELISSRTKAALAEKKRQGAKLGTPNNLTQEARNKGVLVRQQKANEKKENRQATELILLYRKQGLSFQSIVDKLNNQGYKTSRGKLFYRSTVKMLLDRSNTT